ncbi:hypothetical protein AB3S75_038657 [Citrus x aurantiifolia]
MFDFFRSPAKPKQKTVNPVAASDDECDKKAAIKPARRTSSEPVLITPDFSNDHKGRDHYKNDFRDSGGLENQSVQELENYAVYKAEETTNSVNNCLKIAENIREDATKTLDMLHQQGEQIHRTHNMVADTEKDLSKGEKQLNNLGGMFSKTWKPKKTRNITGPLDTPDHSSKKGVNKGEREKLGVAPVPKPRSGSRTPPPEPANAMQKVEMEKAKQDDALSDLSNILGDLKGMAVDMGGELDRQNKSLDHLDADVDELNSRVKGANQRARHLLGK